MGEQRLVGGTDAKLLGELASLGMTINQVKDAMAAIGYGKDALHQLDRWESKRTTGRFGR